MKKFSKFDKAYNLVMEQIDVSNGLTDTVEKLKNEYSGKSGYKRAIEADPEGLQKVFETAVANTKKAFDAARESGEEIEVYNPYSCRWRKAKIIDPMKAPGELGKLYSHKKMIDPDNYCFLFDNGSAKIYGIETFILGSESEKIWEAIKAGEQKFYDDEEEKKNKMENSPEFTKFKADLKEKGFGSVLGSNESIGKNVPEEFFDFFSQQSDDVKKMFIDYVKNYSVYPSGLEYYDGQDYYKAIDEGDKKKKIKEAFLEKLKSC